jgi:hypothetical protein
MNDIHPNFESMYNQSPKPSTRFSLSKEFVAKYAERVAPFGFNGVGEFTYQRTYSRIKPDGKNEQWHETVERVVNGTYELQRKWVESRSLGWDDSKAQASAQEMFDRMYNLKFTPPGRGLWVMGTDITETKNIFAALNNCAFVSTKNIATETSKPFRFLMDMSMLGVGCGFDVQGAGTCNVYSPGGTYVWELGKRARIDNERAIATYVKMLEALITENNEEIEKTTSKYLKAALDITNRMYADEICAFRELSPKKVTIFKIADTREAWVASVGAIIDSYLVADAPIIVFDYSAIRAKGLPLKTFGGLSSGPVPLIDLHIELRRVLGAIASTDVSVGTHVSVGSDKSVGSDTSVGTHVSVGSAITITAITDIMNLIGKCVVAGNVRRSSEIALGPAESEEFVDLKNYEKNPHRAAYGWCSNNTVYATNTSDYSKLAKRIEMNGEPGVIWLDNCRGYSRMNGVRDDKDIRAEGTNPCSEQTLESYELCCLVECFPTRCADIEDFKRTLKFAYLYAKTVTLGESHWVETNRVMMRNRRIGCSMTGIAQFLATNSMPTLKQWCTEGYDVIQSWDKIYSEWLSIPRSLKTTSVKPSGCMEPFTEVFVTDEPHDSAKGFFRSAIKLTMEEIFADNGIDLRTADVGHYPTTRDYYTVGQTETGEPTVEKITGLFVNGDADIYEVPLSDDTFVQCTGNHRFLIDRRVHEINGNENVCKTIRMWCAAADLEIGDEVVCSD